MLPLPKPSIDTGMGLERISAILQGVHSNYEIDLFQHLISAAAEIVGTQDLENKSLRVIADHIRSCSFLICDGVMPSNEGRGYVLRRIIRRAVRHGYKMGADDIFFYKLVNTLVAEMGDAYPELLQQQAVVEKVLKVEEEQFAKTLERGMAILNDSLSQLEGKQVPGELVFKLYDTYGFPADLTNDVAREQGLTIDEAGFETAMAQQKSQSQSASKFGADYANVLSIEHKTEFTGYTDVNGASIVMDIIVNNAAVTEASDQALILLKRTPFYAESGGQVGDTGFMSSSSGKAVVIDTVKLGQAFAHKVKIEGVIRVGDKVELVIDQARRERIKANHSATHLLHAALRQLLGDHVAQKGSLVDAEKLRFDFSHFDSISAKQRIEIENLVNAEIRLNNALTTQLMELDEAKASGAMALFGEKYDEKVRVVKMGEFSTELCGGTHVARTGDIGLLKITSEGGIASGVRRIEATTGQMALDFANDESNKLHAIASLLKSDKTSVVDKVSTAVQQVKLLEKELTQLKQSMAGQKSKDVMSNVIDVQGVKLLVANMQGVEPKALRGMMDDLKNQLRSGVIALGVASDGKVNLIAGVTKDLVGKFKAGELVNHMATQVGGKGGGRPDMAQAGGTEPENLDKALASVKTWLEGNL
jgi:alanyl-tRNA synthetase